jgi:signal transduction histidine kinase
MGSGPGFFVGLPGDFRSTTVGTEKRHHQGRVGLGMYAPGHPAGRCGPGTVGLSSVPMDDLTLPFAQRLSARQWTVVDIALAALFALGTVSEIASGHAMTPTGTAWLALRYACVGVSCASLPFRRRFPIAVLGAVAVALAFLCALSGEPLAVFVLLPVAYSVASTSNPRTSLLAIVGALAIIEVGALPSNVAGHGTAALLALAFAATGWLTGVNAQARRAYATASLERAAEREREREQRAQRAGAEERLRIARELHDVVAHAMSIIAVRSGVARMTLDARPDEAREALGIIEGTSRQALSELRLLVGILRSDEGHGIEADRQPAPGLADLPELVTRINEAGVSVGVHVEGVPRPLGPGADLSAYRIVQEALTNVVRHAAPASAELSLRYSPSQVVIEVTDTECAWPKASSSRKAELGGGHGIVGMRERVAVYGGTFVAEPTPSGFRVLAHIPIEESSR